MSEFLDWVKMRSHLFRGVTFGTMLRDEAYHFIRLGTHLERADNTARILDVKYHIAAAARGRRRRRRRLLPVGRAAALGLRLRVVPQDLQRRDHAAARRRAADPARRHAALAARLHELHPRHARAPLRRRTAASSSALAGELHARAALRPDRRHHPLRAARVPDGLPRSGSRRWATRSAAHFLVPRT